MNLVLAIFITTTPLDDALALALENNASLKVARAEINVAEASVPLMHDWEMPKLRGQLSDAQDVGSGTFTWVVRLSWAPPNPWQWKHGTVAGEAEVVGRRADLANSSWGVMKELRLAWLDLSGADAHGKLAHETYEVRHQLLSVLRKRLERGTGTQIELNLAQLGEQDAKQDEQRYVSAGLRATQSIVWLVGVPLEPQPTSLPAEPPSVPDLDELETRLGKHPALESLRARVREAEAKVKNEQAKRLPWPEVLVGLRQKASATPDNNLQLSLTVPLGITPAPEVDVARAVVARNRSQLDAEVNQRKAELRILIQRAEGLRSRWLSFEADYRATIESHRALRAQLLADGSLDPTLLLTAERVAIDLEHKRLDIQLDLARALVELDNIAGPP